MPIIYHDRVKRARMNAVTADAGAAAVLEIGTAGMATVLATIPLESPIAPGATGAGVLTLSGFPKTVAAGAAGVPAAARVRQSVGGADIFTGLTVGLAATVPEEADPDVVLDSVDIRVNQAVKINGVTITHAQ